jgi:PAS domain S-box-containing protein
LNAVEGNFVSERRRQDLRWSAAGLAFLLILVVLDVAVSDQFSLIGAFGVAPFIAAVGATQRHTIAVAVLAVAAAIGVSPFDHIFGTGEFFARSFTVVVASAVAVQVSVLRNRGELASELEHITARTLATSPTPEEATSLILERIAGVLGWQTGAFWEADADRDLLHCVALWHQPGLNADAFFEETRALELAGGAGLPGEVWRLGRPAWVGDVNRDAGFRRAKSAAAAGLRGGAAFPIVSSAGVLGVIEFFTTEGPRSDSSLLRAMGGVGSQLGQYIERRRASVAAERSGALKSAVVDSALDCVITMDSEGRVVDFSRSAEETFGYPRAGTIGKDLADLIIPPDLREQHRSGIARFLATGEGRLLNRRMELTGMRADGSQFPVEVSVSRVAGVEPPLFAGYLRDITARREGERERERLLEQERDQRLRAQRLERRASYLAEVQRALDATFDDYEDALRKLARLVVPRIGDWCVIQMVEDDTVRTVAVEHSDPAKRSLAWELQERYPPDLERSDNLAQVIETGKPQLIAEIPEALIAEAAQDAHHAEILHELGLQSAMMVPLRSRGETLGAMSFASAESEHRFDEEDLAFAMEVARRAGLSISNARLYHEVQQRQREIEFLAQASIELDSTMDVDETLQRLADLTVPYIGDGCMVDLLEEGDRMRRVASASADSEVSPVLSRLRAHELDLSSPHPIAKAMRTGTVQLINEISAELRESWSADTQYLRDLRDWPARAVVVAPLVARGRVLGTIAIASFGERRFAARDVALIEELARRAAVSVYNARLYSERSYIASRLQHSLLPPHLPEVPGMEIAARFRPAGEANEVGGDFYDIYQTAGGRWALVIGDVCGKGADAASVTAIARYTLRAATMHSQDGPEHSLRLLNEVLMQQVTPDRFCTVAYATLDLNDGVARLSVASGGHPTPLIVRADGTVSPIGDPGTLLGVVSDPVLHEATTELHPGDSVVFYTDGLTEARIPEGLFDEERLIETLQRCGGLDPPTVTDHIEQALTDLRAQARDDIAILVAQVSRHGALGTTLGEDLAVAAK